MWSQTDIIRSIRCSITSTSASLAIEAISVAELGQLVLGQAAGWLVEQQQPGLASQGTGERDPFARSMWQRLRHPVGQVGGAHPVERLERDRREPGFVGVRPRQPGER